MDTPTRLDIVIVAWNNAPTIRRCLASLEPHRSPAIHVVVVDNASKDATRDEARCFEATGVSVIANASNRGFAAACNQGAQMGTAPAILFLNPDCEIQGDALTALQRCLEANKQIAAVGARLVDADGAFQDGFAVRRFPRLMDFFAEALLLNQWMPRNPWNRRYRCLGFSSERSQTVEQPAGACLLVRRTSFEAVHGFDEGFYPAWFEDVDLCRRVHDQGGEIYYCAAATVRHVGGASVQVLPVGQSAELFFLNMIRYSKKHFGGVKTLFLRGCLVFGMLARLMILAVFPGAASRSRSAAGRLQGNGDGLRWRTHLAGSYWRIAKGALGLWRL